MTKHTHCIHIYFKVIMLNSPDSSNTTNRPSVSTKILQQNPSVYSHCNILRGDTFKFWISKIKRPIIGSFFLSKRSEQMIKKKFRGLTKFHKIISFKKNYRLTVDHFSRRGLFCGESFILGWQEILVSENVYQIKES